MLSWARSVSFRRRSKSNILRFLQEKCLQWVGGLQEIHSDARVLAATNRNLQESMAGGKFREDLYFRLAVVVVKVPPLRERGDDTVLVAKAFLHKYGVEHAKPGLTFAPDALRALGVHRWPGNVREMQNGMRRAGIMAGGKRGTARDLELADTLSALPSQTLKEARETVEREMLQDALADRGRSAGARPTGSCGKHNRTVSDTVSDHPRRGHAYARVFRRI